MEENSKHPKNQKRIKFKKNIIGNKNENKKKWVMIITVLSFIMTGFFLLISELLLKNASNIISLLIVLIIVSLGILFDIIGIAVTAADEAPFHALASRKYFGAKQSLKLIRNANKVSSFCNDVVGDICGVISGVAGAMIVIKITIEKSPLESTVYGLITSGAIAAVTVGGKALGKTIAMSNSDYIVYNVGSILQFVSNKLDIINIRRYFKSRK